MKKIFKFKFELMNITLSVLAVIISYSMYLDGSDWRTKAIMFICGGWLLLSIFGYKFVKEFRQDVLKRW